ncbi:MAG: hypothetical protein IKN96_07635 [Oscillibacter sp.]|nr:hypothetical protein [Oscillibacter sp.]
MIGGLERVVRWRDASEETPQKAGYVLAAYLRAGADGDPIRGRVPSIRAAYWDGREFLTADPPFSSYPLREVTHWAPYPDLPSAAAMREAFRRLLGKETEETPC